jgi:hypothetical protein
VTITSRSALCQFCRELLQRGERLLVAGRCLSAEHETMTSARITAQCFSYGQAIGMAAAMCRRNDEARGRSTYELMEALRKDGAVT